MNFMKKFITFAKQVKPTLTTAAANYIGEKYADLREFDETKEDRERVNCRYYDKTSLRRAVKIEGRIDVH